MNMDICRFIKSKAMREHLSNYNFNAVEAAYIILRSDLAFKEQNEAWQQVINTMPDCETPEGESVHRLLTECIKERTQLFVELTDNNDKYIYSHYANRLPKKFFDNFNQCFNSAIEEAISEENEEILIRVYKKGIDSYYSLVFSVNGEIIQIRDLNCCNKLREETIRNWALVFPHPFKKGDAVHFVGECVPMVVAPEEEKQEYLDFDNGIGVYMWMIEKITYEVVPYLFLDYYIGEFDDEYTIIRLIRRFLKSGQGLEEMLNKYHLELLEKEKLEFSCR